MSTKIIGIIFVALFLIELTAAGTVRHHEIIIKSNGDKIERTWTTHNGVETELNNENNFHANDGASEHNKVVTSFSNTNFALPTLVSRTVNDFQPVEYGSNTNLMVPQINPATGIKPGQFEEVWDLEPEQPAKPEESPRENQHNRNGLPDLAKQPNSPWKPIDSNININEPWHTQARTTEVLSWPVTQQKPLAHETPYNLNGVHYTQTYSSKPIITKQIITTGSLNGPDRYFVSGLPNLFTWTRQNGAGGVEQTTQMPEYHMKEVTEKYPYNSLDELLQQLYGGEATPTTKTATTTTTPKPVLSTTAKAKHRPITTINIADLPIADILKNGQPIDGDSLKTLPEHLRPLETTVDNIQHSYSIQNIPMTQESDLKMFASPLPQPRTPTPKRRVTSSTQKPAFVTTPKPQAASPESNIAKFLSKVDLRKDDILFQTPGRTVTKTIIDDNGDILTATFMLSSVKDRAADSKSSPIEIKPLK